jgi:thymidylate synthase (FAD)
MKVDIIAATQIITRQPMTDIGYTFHDDEKDLHIADASELSEFAGRLCYKSWNRPNPATATNQGYLANIQKQRHFSVLEHGTVTFLISDISRNCTHEIVRHRHFSFSQVSQRYVDETSSHVVIPEILSSVWEDDNDFALDGSETIDHLHYLYEQMVTRLKLNGVTGKKARQAARFILPGGTETAIVVSGNHRSWREFIEKRYLPGKDVVDPEIWNVARLAFNQLSALEPNIYQDLYHQVHHLCTRCKLSTLTGTHGEGFCVIKL